MPCQQRRVELWFKTPPDKFNGPRARFFVPLGVLDIHSLTGQSLTRLWDAK